MSFENIKTYQKDVVKLIDNSFEMNRLASVYLFSGPRGTGKLEAAYYFASKLLNIDDIKLLKSSEHLHILSVDDGTIKRDDILDLMDEFALTSDSPEIFIINGAEKIGERNSNTLLKFLEGMRDNSYGILLSEDSAHILPTIKSRSLIVHFRPINRNIVRDELIKKGISSDTATIVSFLTFSLDEALSLSQSEDFVSLIDLCVNVNKEIETDGNPMLYMELEGRDLFKSDNRNLNSMFFEMLIAYQRDKIEYLSSNKLDGLCFKEAIKENSINKSIEEEIDILDIMLKEKDRLNYYVNVELLYSSMFIEIKRC